MSILDKFEVTELTESRSKELLAPFEGQDIMVQIQPGGWVYHRGFKRFADEYVNFEYYDDDVIVQTMAKSGTTWAQEIVWTMRNNPTLDPEKMTQPLHLRSPNFEVDMSIYHVNKPQNLVEQFTEKFPDYDPANGMFLHLARTSPRPRTIKTHMPLALLNPKLMDKAKIVYVIRDPRDVCLSYMHHCRIFLYENFTGSLDQYVDAFLEDHVTFGPYWAHVSQAWALRNHPNMHITFYEKLKKNPKAEYERLNKFLGTKLTSEQIEKVIHFTSFAEMKNRKQHLITSDDENDVMDMALEQKDGGFFRQGTAGGWRKVLSQGQQDRFLKWIEKNCPDKQIMENILNP